MLRLHAEAEEAYPGTPMSAGNASDVDPALSVFVEVTLIKVLTGDETASSDSSRPAVAAA